jgi:Phage tail assembly chaperone protein
MGIVAESNVPNLVLQLSIVDRGIVYRGMLKVVPDQYWENEVRPKLYPMWDTEKDRLTQFTWYDNNTYHCVRRKYIKNFKTNEYEWKDYEMQQTDIDAAIQLYNFLKETFLNIEQITNDEFQEEMGRIYGEIESETWMSVRLARNFLLQETDYVFSCSDVEISDEKKEIYKKYRQALRDLPQHFGDVAPKKVKFPLSPEAYEIYKKDNPGEEYLETKEQWIALSSFFYTTFRDKMVRYLSVRDVTDRLYMQAFVAAINENPTEIKEHPLNKYTGKSISDYDDEGQKQIQERLDLLLETLAKAVQDDGEEQ